MKRLIKALFTVAVVLTTFVYTTGGIETAAATNGNDISSKVTIDDVALYSLHGHEDWTAIEGGETLVAGMTLKLEVKWHIDAANMVGVLENDFFSIAIDSNYLSINDTTGSRDLVDGSDNIIGSWKIVDNKFVATLNADGAGALSLNKGFFEVFVQLTGEGTDVEINIGGELLPPINVETPDIDENQGSPMGSAPHFEKSGGQLGYSKDVEWSININDDSFLMLYQDQNAAIPTLGNVLLIDELPPTFQYIDDSIEVVSYVPVPYDSTGTGLYIDDMRTGEPLFALNFTSRFVVVRNNDGESQEAFQARVHSSSTPTIGLYENRVLYMAFGDLPGTGNDLRYFDNDTDLREQLDYYDVISSQQKDIMFDMLKSDGPLNGNAISFRVKFKMTSDNETQISSITNNATLLYNESTKHESDYEIKYQWENAGVQPGEPLSVTLLKQDGDSKEIITGVGFKLQKWNTISNIYEDHQTPNNDLVEYTDGSGRVTFTGLKQGKYRIVEVSRPIGYTDEIVFVPGSNEFEIIGTELGAIKYIAYNYKDENYSEKTEISGTKHWVGDEDFIDYRPENINLILEDGHGNVINTDASSDIVLTWDKVTDVNAWTYTFKNLDKYDDQNNEINYVVKEEKIVNYDVEYGQDNEIINTFNPEYVNLTGTKTWNDENNQAGFRPTTIELSLEDTKGNTYTATPTWTNTNQDVWTYTFTGLMKYYPDGEEISYRVREINVDANYSVIYAENGLDIINVHTPTYIDITGTKTWNDVNNQAGFRPETIKLTLSDQFGNTYNAVPTWTNTETNVWTYRYSNLPEYKNAVRVVYTVTEESVAHYAVEYASNGLDLINTHTPTYVEVTGTKTWDDQGNINGHRPSSIELQIMDQDGVIYDVVPTWTNTDQDVWTYTYSGLPEYKNGKLQTYVVIESFVENYTASYDSSQLHITNVYTPGKMSITGTKTWNDQNNIDGLRPDMITLILMDQFGNEYDLKPVWINTDKNVWTYIYTDLPNRINGVPAEYSVIEVSVEHYETTYDENNKLNIINSYTPEVPEKPVLPNTGIASPLTMTGVLIVVGAMFIVLAKAFKKQTDK